MNIQNLVELNKRPIDEFNLFNNSNYFSVKFKGAQSFLIELETMLPASAGATRIDGVYPKFGIYSVYNNKGGYGFRKLGSDEKINTPERYLYSPQVCEEHGFYVITHDGAYSLETHECLNKFDPTWEDVIFAGNTYRVTGRDDKHKGYTKWFDSRTHNEISKDDQLHQKIREIQREHDLTRFIGGAGCDGIYYGDRKSNIGFYHINDAAEIEKIPSALGEMEGFSGSYRTYNKYYGYGIYLAYVHRFNEYMLYDFVENKPISKAMRGNDELKVWMDCGIVFDSDIFGKSDYFDLGGEMLFQHDVWFHVKASDSVIGVSAYNPNNNDNFVGVSKISDIVNAPQYAEEYKGTIMGDTFAMMPTFLECKKREDARKDKFFEKMKNGWNK